MRRGMRMRVAAFEWWNVAAGDTLISSRIVVVSFRNLETCHATGYMSMSSWCRTSTQIGSTDTKAMMVTIKEGKRPLDTSHKVRA